MDKHKWTLGRITVISEQITRILELSFLSLSDSTNSKFRPNHILWFTMVVKRKGKVFEFYKMEDLKILFIILLILTNINTNYTLTFFNFRYPTTFAF